jgi:Tol biopolymer transport system component
MKLRYMFLKAFFVFGIAWAVQGCSSTTDPDTTNAKPTGKLYYNENAFEIYSVDLTTGKKTNFVPGYDPYRTPEGTIICRNDNGLVEYNSTGTSARLIVDQHEQAPFDVKYDDHFQNPQLSPDGKYIAYEGKFSTSEDFYVVDRYTGKLLFSYYPENVLVGYSRPTWTPDNRIVVSGGTNNPGLFISSADWKTFTRFDPDLNKPKQPIVSPDGKTVAFIMNEHLWTIGIDGTGLKQITTSDWHEAWPTWSSDGKWIAISGNASILLLPMSETGYVNVRNITGSFITNSSTQFSWR